jgi:hypothetical protein
MRNGQVEALEDDVHEKDDSITEERIRVQLSGKEGHRHEAKDLKP